MCQLYIKEQGSKVRRIGRRLIVEKDDEEIMEIPIHRLERVVTFGRIQFTSSALALLLDRGVELVMVTSRGKLRGVLCPPLSPNVDLRRKQYRFSDDELKCIEFSKLLVVNKMNNTIAALKRLAANRVFSEYKRALENIEYLRSKIDLCTNKDQLRGYEGGASKCYFACLIEIYKSLNMEFSGRLRRPPRDPINSCLSFVYVLLTELISSSLLINGFDVFCGFMHEPNRNAPALALDFIEQFRQPIADRFVMYMFHKRFLNIDSFIATDKYPVAIGDKPKRNLLVKWEEFLNKEQYYESSGHKISAMNLINKYCLSFKKCLLNEKQFVFFEFNYGG